MRQSREILTRAIIDTYIAKMGLGLSHRKIPAKSFLQESYFTIATESRNQLGNHIIHRFDTEMCNHELLPVCCHYLGNKCTLHLPEPTSGRPCLGL